MNYYVQYGCGWSAPKEWINFDSSLTLRFERIPVIGKTYTKNARRFPENVMFGDIVKGLPLENGSCRGIFASHVLEHLSLEDFRLAIRNTFDLLEPDGIFRLIVPDLRLLVQSYLGSSDPKAALILMRKLGMGVEASQRGMRGVAQKLWGNSAHLWMWDFESLYCELEKAGFSEIRRCEFGDSSDSKFGLVENPERYVNSVGVEAIKRT